MNRHNVNLGNEELIPKNNSPNEQPDEKEEIIKTEIENKKLKELIKFTNMALDSCEKYQGSENVLLILGKTGSGKSTSINALLGYKMIKVEKPIPENTNIDLEPDSSFSDSSDSEEGDKIKKDYRIDVDIKEILSRVPNIIDDRDIKPSLDSIRNKNKNYLSDFLPRIGHSTVSETLFPKCYQSFGDNISYCDMPGFGDNRSDARFFATIISTNILIKRVKSIKGVLLVSKISDLYGRGTIFLNNALNGINNMFQGQSLNGNIANPLKSMFFLFTKCGTNENKKT